MCAATAQGFHVILMRWIVQRTLGWFNRYRRLSKKYDLLPQTSEAVSRVVRIHLMTVASRAWLLFEPALTNYNQRAADGQFGKIILPEPFREPKLLNCFQIGLRSLLRPFLYDLKPRLPKKAQIINVPQPILEMQCRTKECPGFIGILQKVILGDAFIEV
jgi:hypothetical protein